MQKIFEPLNYDFEKFKCLSGSSLKVIALLTMLIDHSGAFFLKETVFANDPFITIGPHSLTLYKLLRLAGRLSFPLYCFLITEGYIHTRDKKKYGVNLLGFALVSEIPWNLVHNGKLLYSVQNVFFTLFLGFIAIYVYDLYKNDNKKLFIALMALFVVAQLLRADYGTRGMGFILFLYIMRDKRILQAVVGSCFFSRAWAIMPAFIPINMYNGERGFIKGKAAKYAFYAIYPLHLLLLYFLKAKYIGY